MAPLGVFAVQFLFNFLFNLTLILYIIVVFVKLTCPSEIVTMHRNVIPFNNRGACMAWHGLIDGYRRFLPVSEKTPVISLCEGNTPLIPAVNLAGRIKFPGT